MADALSGEFTMKRILVWGMTAPEWSEKYFETVCTGAIDGETGRLIRIYPIKLQALLNNRFRKYSWINAPLARSRSDFRPESYKIDQDRVQLTGEHLDTKDGWVARSEWVLRESNVFASVEDLIAQEKVDHTSLGLVRPKEILDVKQYRLTDADKKEFEAHREKAKGHKELFADVDANDAEIKELSFVPVEYKIEFRCHGTDCKTHNMKVRDWEIHQAQRRRYAEREGNATQAMNDVLGSIQMATDLTKRDTHFFLGNMLAHSQTFTIVGIFYPPIDKPKKNEGRKASKKAPPAADKQGSLFGT